jgi:hypothetical protein
VNKRTPSDAELVALVIGLTILAAYGSLLVCVALYKLYAIHI